MKETTENLIGGINLYISPNHPDKGTINDIPGAKKIMFNSERGIFIPVDNNPAINIWNQDGDENKQIVSLALSIREKRQASEKSSHFAKLYIGKEKAKSHNLTETQEKEMSPIIGNFRKYINRTKALQTTPPPTQPDTDEIGDLPPDDMSPQFQSIEGWK